MKELKFQQAVKAFGGGEHSHSCFLALCSNMSYPRTGLSLAKVTHSTVVITKHNVLLEILS